MTASVFDQCFAIVVGSEGRYTNDPRDPGNWTDQMLGSGELLGTNWGISAAAYPELDIKNLTEAEAKAIYLRDYWGPAYCDLLAQKLALFVFDAAINNGVSAAKRWLQAAAGVSQDGFIGPVTLAAVARADVDSLCAEFLAQRMFFMASRSTWSVYGLGWSRRLSRLPFQAATLKN